MSEIVWSARDSAEHWYTGLFAFNELYAQWAKKHGMNYTILFCLYAIRRSEGEPTPGHVATVLRLSKQTVNSALDILESKGYISRHVDPVNRRSRRITLLPLGQSAADEVLDDLYALEKKIFGKLSQRDRKSLMRLTSLVVSNLEEAVNE
ncbi:MAG: MarR family transcriptional regulator [Clostridia bacterium]|nr:MarR family transcriptional regulator [Clostridia bacterium]